MEFDSDIKTIEQVKEKYSHIHNIDSLLKNNIVKKLIDKEYMNLCEDEKFYKKKINSKRDNELHKLAEARGLYRFLYCTDRITMTMTSWGWDRKDILVLIKRIERAGMDPWDMAKNTAAEFIESLPSRGHPLKNIDGECFRCYDPRTTK